MGARAASPALLATHLPSARPPQALAAAPQRPPAAKASLAAWGGGCEQGRVPSGGTTAHSRAQVRAGPRPPTLALDLGAGRLLPAKVG